MEHPNNLSPLLSHMSSESCRWLGVGGCVAAGGRPQGRGGPRVGPEPFRPVRLSVPTPSKDSPFVEGPREV